MKESFFSTNLLLAVALLLSVAVVGYNAFLMPDYAPASITYPAPAQNAPDGNSTFAGNGEGFTVNVNTADEHELQRVPGIGPVMAGKLLEYRERVGVITNLQELLAVNGIGEATLEKLAPYLALEG